MKEVVQQGLSPIRQETAPLRLRIIESMRRAIERGVLLPGARLVEKDLCQQLGVSRTSLRPATRVTSSRAVTRSPWNWPSTMCASTLHVPATCSTHRCGSTLSTSSMPKNGASPRRK